MPLHLDSTQLKHGQRLVLWKTTETTDELISIANLHEAELEELNNIQLEKRRREWLDTRILLKTFFPKEKLGYLENGKPVFKDGSHLSISHCEDFVGIIVSDKSIGMDIQNIDKKLLLIQKKFCNEKELSFIPKGEEGLELTTIVWSAKEAIFKVFGENVLFAGHITMRPFSAQDKTIIADYAGIYGKRVFELEHLMVDDFHFVIAQ